jgi:hypothetical protein
MRSSLESQSRKFRKISDSVERKMTLKRMVRLRVIPLF